MKFKLLTSLVAAVTVVSCNNKKEDTQTKADPKAPVKPEAPAKPVVPEKPAPVEPDAPVVPDVKPSVVSGSIAAVVQKIDGDKYVSTQIKHNTDYFLVYFTASW